MIIFLHQVGTSVNSITHLSAQMDLQFFLTPFPPSEDSQSLIS